MDESGRRIVWPTTRITHTLQHAPDIKLATEKKEGPPPGQRDSPQISASSTGAMRGPGRQHRFNSDKAAWFPGHQKMPSYRPTSFHVAFMSRGAAGRN